MYINREPRTLHQVLGDIRKKLKYVSTLKNIHIRRTYKWGSLKRNGNSYMNCIGQKMCNKERMCVGVCVCVSECD